jgi:pseudouridine kinase
MVLMDKEKQILQMIRLNPFISQQELAEQLGLSRSAIAGYISTLTRQGEIKGRAYILREESSIVCIGTTNFDRKAQSKEKLIMGTANPVTYTESCGGVARNVAENLARLGFHSVLVSCVGNDKEGLWLLEETRACKVDVSQVNVLPDHRTGTYTALLDTMGDMHICLADLDICEQISSKMIAERWSHITSAQLVFMDGNLSAEALKYVTVRSRDENIRLFVDPVSVPDASKLPESLEGINTIFPNKGEASFLAGGQKMENIDDYRAAARKIRERGVRNVIITLGEEGIFYMSETYDEFLLPSYRNEVVDVTGAGDAFASGYMCGMVQGEDAKTACQLGLAASSLTVQTNRSVSQKLHADLIYSMVSSN